MEFITFFARQYDRLLLNLLQHLQIVLLALLLAILFAVPVGFLLYRNRWLSNIVLGIFSALYAIPSLAVFTFLLPVTGLGMRTAVIVIAIYAQFILLRSTITAFQSIHPAVIEASRGMGLGGLEIFFRIELPLAAPVLVSGIRLATVASVGIATIAATINSGGIGTLLFEGVRTLHTAKLLWGVVLAACLSLTANQLLSMLEVSLRKRARGERGKRRAAS